VAGTIYEATHYAVLSNFLLFSALKVYHPIPTSTVTQTQSTVYPQLHRPNVIPTSINILHKKKTVYISILLRKEEVEQNILKLQ
jgi:hypothetical protein